MLRNTLAGTLSFALAASAGADQLLGTQISGVNFLMDINRDTAAWTLIGNTNVGGAMNGIAYDAVHDVLYGINPASDNLFTINRTTGAATPVGPNGSLGFGNANGLAYDPVHNILYGTDNNTNALFTINTTTGVGATVAIISGGFTEIEGLGYDPATETLYGLTQLQARVVKINVTTGAATALPTALPAGIWRGLDFDTNSGVLYATTVNPSNLYRVDATSGAPTLIGNLAGAAAVQGLAYVPDPSAPCPGDLDGDKMVGQSDLGILLAAFGTCPGDPGYNAAAGALAGDPCVTQADLGVLLANYGVVCP